ncbi:baseplate wedge initiator [Synechococcus phage ACG-2014f]|uniref:Baseplate wedge initiator n=1 Tax=Synechococcus phage ACG-2014f TaxID=1493511 RepID=A0A0E3I2R1_9CAUD|nr:baseplate wedge initiator [Synechococcus phage ACG-2014f]AIX43178.1 baseplate wedge initiator [Synechococcus phage ACG-2014f]
MIGTELGIDVRVKIQDVVSSQLPDYILSEAPLTDDFLKQFYISQEYQGGTVDFASNLDQYLSLTTLGSENLYTAFELTQDVSIDDTIIHVNTTSTFPNEWGLLKIDDEIVTYTGLTTNTFTGVVRGFSGISSYRDSDNPSELVFETTTAATHTTETNVENLSTLFLKNFYDKLKYTFAPGFENLEFNSEVSVGQWIRQARSFYQSKGSEESFKILFRVLYGEDPLVIDLEQFLIKPSQAEYSRRDYAVAIPVSGNPITLKGKTVYQSDAEDVFGAISEIETFTRDNKLYYRIYFFVSNDEIANERKLFTIPGRSRTQRGWNQGDTTITVDTTLGFRDNNEFITEDGTKFTYLERTVNQFLGVECSDTEKTLGVNEDIIDDITIFGINDAGETVSLRMTGVISDIEFPDEVPFTTPGEKISVDTLGENIISADVTRSEPTQRQIIANSFIYNTSVRMEVDELNGSDFQINTAYLDKAFISPGDSVDILQRGSQIVYVANRKVTSVDYLNSIITINDSFGIPLDQSLDIRRNQNYAKSSTTDIEYGQNSVLSNVLNLYDATEFDGNFYVATNSLPSYDMEVKVVESILTGITTSNFEGYNSFTDQYSTIIFDSATSFITGDLISYRVISVERTGIPLITEGEYFVEVLSNPRKIKLYVSPSFIGSDNFVGFVYNDAVGAHAFTLEEQKDRRINTKNVFKKIPFTATKQNITIPRTPDVTPSGSPVAVLTNGVEVLSYKSPDKVFLGPLEEVVPVASGEGYSVIGPPNILITPPNIQVTDPTGIPTDGGVARVSPVISGRLKKIYIDPQDFDIEEVFSITVVGGNSRGATAKPQISKRTRSIPFDTRLDIYGGGINPNEETILFLTEHKLAKGDAIIYENNDTQSIGVNVAGGSNIYNGQTLSNGAVYFAEPLNNVTIKIYETLEDLNLGINTVGFTSSQTGFGVQDFTTIPRNQLTGAFITDDGGEFVYRKMEFQPENIYPEYDELRYDGHGFSSGDLVEYGTFGSVVGGLSTEKQYYVDALDENVIKLSDAGIGGTSRFDYDRKDYVDFTNIGVGTQFIKYPDVTVNVVVSYASSITGIITATPIIRGGIIQTYVETGGYYGSDILNFAKTPEVTVQTGEGARIKPVIVNGKVTTVQILSKGINYPPTPDIRVIDKSRKGAGALLRPVVIDGVIQSVVVISTGENYDPLNTDITVIDTARRCILVPRITPLTVNTFARFGFEGLSNNDYSVVAYDRKIREDVYGDLGASHSPIIGWANDGNPIYGGFGFDDPENSSSGFRAMRTSYELFPGEIYGRPPLTLYPAGSFVEDYKFTDNGDLDIYNGRYGRTPEYPNGVYAYFAGISTDTQSLAREPQFPYFIGPEFRDGLGIQDNTVSQDFDINNKDIFRNTFPYAVGNPIIGSEFLDQSYLEDTQDSIIQSINNGTVDNLTIVGAGVSYSVGDIVNFDDTFDYISVVVDQVDGPEVTQIQTLIKSYGKAETKVIKVDNTTVRVYVDPFHEYLDGDKVVISGLSTNTDQLNGTHEINFMREQMTMFAPIPPTLFETVSDIFVNTISDKVSVGSSITVGLGTLSEDMEVINIFPINKALRVKRPVGYGFTHPIGDAVNIAPNYFDIKKNVDSFPSEIDVEYYFNPHQTVAVGLETGASVGLVYSIGTIDKNISVQTQRIYAPSHGFRTGEEITFEKNDTDTALVVTDGSTVYTLPGVGNTSNAYVVSLSKNYIGIRTVTDGPDLFFSTDGSDSPLYSIKTNRFAETALVDRIQAEVKTKTDHRLGNDDQIFTDVISSGKSGVGTNPNIKLEFDDSSQSLIVDPYFTQPSDIDTVNNLININNHGYTNGDIVLYQNYGSSIGGLTTHHKYYTIPFDRDKFYVAETFVDVRPGTKLPVNLTSVGIGSHKFSKVNPPLLITNNNDIEFDVSSPTLFGKTLEFFFDRTLTEIFDNNSIDNVFVVSGVSTEGYEDARKSIRYSDNNPDVFFYGITEGGYISTADTEVSRNNSIRYEASEYAIEGRVTVIDDSTFTYTLNTIPEKPLYTNPDTQLSYKTSSSTALGGVGRLNIIFSGNNFPALPEFEGIQTEYGQNATIRAESDDIGTLASFRIQNAGWDYSADNTLRPFGVIQPTIRFDNSDFVTEVTVLDGGNGYQNPPNAVLVDSVTREVVDNGSIILEVQSSTITDVIVEVAPSGLSKDLQELWTVNNSNGIPILLIGNIDNVAGVVTYTVQTPIEGYATPPFSVGDRVFVENILVDQDAPPSKLNSGDYGYQFLEVVAVTPTNPITIGIQYPEEAIGNLGYGVTFQQAFSGIVNEDIYPKFAVQQTTAVFLEGERLSIFDSFGNLDETDLVVEESNTSFFKVTGNYDLLVGDVLKGNNSGVILTVTEIDSSSCRYLVDSISRINTGWNDKTGFLNEETQNLPDNDYYQNLSYSIKSTINFEELINPVNRLVHPSGLKNFSDTKIESIGDIGVGSSESSESTVTIDFIGLTDIAETPLRVDRINVFDLGWDANVNNNRSNAIRLQSRTPNKRLTDYIEVRTNRVLMHDDISNEFIDSDNASSKSPYSEFNIITGEYTRGLVQARNPFTDQVQFTEIIVLSVDNSAFTLQKASISDNDLGYGIFEGRSLASSEYQMRFTPFNTDDFDIDLKLLSHKFIFSGESAEEIGYVNLAGNTLSTPDAASTQIYGASNSNNRAVVVHANITTIDGLLYYYEIYAFTDGTDVYYAPYGYSSDVLKGFNSELDGDFNATLQGGKLAIYFTNNTGGPVSITTKSIEFKQSFSGTSPYRFKKNNVPDTEERSIILDSVSTAGVSTQTTEVFRYDTTLFQSVRSIVHISGTDVGAIHQVMTINSDGSTYCEVYPFITEGDEVDSTSGIGTFGSSIDGTDMVLTFYPDAAIGSQALTLTSYNETFYRELDEVNYTFGRPLVYSESEENYYLERYIAPLGLRNNLLRFPLTYEGIPIYEKAFDPATTISINNGNLTLFNITEHFFSPAEELYYLPDTTLANNLKSPIEIQPVVDYRGITTSTMPDRVYAIKRDLNVFQLAPTASDALAGQAIVITGFGTGISHRLGMMKKLEKTIITIDGVIQSPITSALKTFNLDAPLGFDDEYAVLTGIGTIRVGDLFLIDEEYLKIDNVGLSTSQTGPISNTGTIPLIEISRGVVGSSATSHTSGSDLDLYRGSFNIVESDVVFTEAPAGRGEININESNLVQVNSSFQGRTFLQREYDQIALFDDISDLFNGSDYEFNITSAGSTIGEIENGSGVLTINDIYQTPTTDNNAGNNYFYSYGAQTGINTLTFTGITSTNGQRVESRFDINQNQIPRGGVIVSLGSTPGLGYAPLYGAKITPVVTGGVITDIVSTNRVGFTTDVLWADYDNETGDLVVSGIGSALTTQFNITDADYRNTSGVLIITSATSLISAGINPGDIMYLRGMDFSCTSGGAPATLTYPDQDPVYAVDRIVDEFRFSVNAGISTIPHTYVSGGTWQKYSPFQFGREQINPKQVYLNGLEFDCTNSPFITTNIFPDSFESASFVTRDDDAHFRLNVGIASFTHDYVGSGIFGQYIENNPGSGYIDRVSIAVTDPNHSGTPAEIVGIPTAGGELSFTIIGGGSGYNQPTTDTFAPDPAYFNLPVIGVSRRNVGFTTITGKNLFVTVEVSAATTTAIGRSEFFEVSGYQITNQGYGFEEGDVIEVVGIPTDKNLSQPIEPFQLTVLDTFTDNFSAWNFGETDYIDSIKTLQDGSRLNFPLSYKGEELSFESNPSNEDSAAIDLDAILLIYVNTVLQVPGVSYEFTGGNTFTFSQPPFPQDDVDIYFYRGKRNIDSTVITEIDESIRPGDQLQLVKNNKYNDNVFIDLTRTQDLRTVTEIASSDTVRTNIYFGNKDLDTLRERQVGWEKQKRDIFIYGEPAPKTRDSLEPVIVPTAAIIRDTSKSQTELFVSNSEIFVYEEDVPGSSIVLTNISGEIYRPVEYKYNPPVLFEPASIRANVDGNGKVTSLTILDAGQGYPTGTEITIGISSTGDRAEVGTTILNPIDGSIISVILSKSGSGYNQSNPPFVLISEPQVDIEPLELIPNIQGFSGIVTGIQATTGSSGATKGIRVFYTVDSTVVASELNAGYSVVLSNTVVGNGVETIGTNAATVVGLGTQFLDAVYEIRSNGNLGINGVWEANVSNGTNISGIDISGDNLGSFSWGRLSNVPRDIDLALSYNVDGTTYSPNMDNYPTLKRSSEGLRNEGGIAKRVL